MPDLNKTVPEQYLKEERTSPDTLQELSEPLSSTAENTGELYSLTQKEAVIRAISELRAPERQYPWGKNHKPFVSETLTEIRKSLAERRRERAIGDERAHHESVYTSLTPEQKINILPSNVYNGYDILKQLNRALNPVRKIVGKEAFDPVTPRHMWDPDTIKHLTYYKPGFLVLSGLEPNSTPDELFYDLPEDPSKLTDATENDLLIGGFDMLEIFDTKTPASPTADTALIADMLPLPDMSDAEREEYQMLFIDIMKKWYERQFDWDDPMQASPSTMLEKVQKRGLENLPVTAPVGFAISKTVGIVPAILAAKFLSPFVPKIAPTLLTGFSRAVTKIIPEEYKDAAWRRANNSLTGKVRQKALDSAEHRAFVAPELKLWAKRRPIAFRPHTQLTDFRRALKSLKTDETRYLLEQEGVHPEGMTMMIIPQFEEKADFNLHDSNVDQERVVRSGLKELFEIISDVDRTRSHSLSQEVRQAYTQAIIKIFGSETVWQIHRDGQKASPAELSLSAVDPITTIHQGVSPIITTFVEELSRT